jgi:hypothetical protein
MPPALLVGPRRPDASPRCDVDIPLPGASDPVIDESPSLSVSAVPFPVVPVEMEGVSGTESLLRDWPDILRKRDLTRARNQVLPSVGLIAVEESIGCSSPEGSSY